MLKALFKKQLLEFSSWIFQDRRTGKARSKGSAVAYIILYVVVLITFAGMFAATAGSLCMPLVSMDMGWLYHSLMCLMAVTIGVFGSVFSTFSSLYLAKDNDLLISLPIPTSRILFVRLFGVWLWGFIYESLVLIPALVIYWTNVPVTAFAVAASIVTLLLVSIFILTLSCILGWVVARVTVKLKNKSFITVLISVIFIGAYYYLYLNAYKMLEGILANIDLLGSKLQSGFSPIYWLGCSAEGNWLSTIPVAAIVLTVFMLTWWTLSRSFLRLATYKSGDAKKEYTLKSIKTGSVTGALLRKEARRLTSSANCMLNCCISGVVFLTGAAIFIVIKGDSVRDLIESIPGANQYVTLIVCGIVCMFAGMNDYAAVAVSLEGSTINLIQSLPVSAWDVLKSKLTLHIITTQITAFIFSVCAAVVTRADALSGIIMVVFPQVYLFLVSVLQLIINLKHPNLTWKNEVAVVKQSIGAFIAVFGSMLMVIVFGFLYVLCSEFLDVNTFLILLSVFLGLFIVLGVSWLKLRGSRIFETL